MPTGSPPTATHRFPVGLTYSALVAALSLGLLTLFGGLGAAGGRGPQPLAHTSSALCLGWSLLAYLLARRAAGRTRRQEEILSVLNMASLVTGLLAVLIILYVAAIEVLCRSVYLEYRLPGGVVIWGSGLGDIAALALAALLSWRHTGHGSLVTAAFWLAILGSLWRSFHIPAARHIGSSIAGYDIPTDWASLFMMGAALATAAFTIFEGMLADHRRRTAWPDALGNLATPYPLWPGFDLTAGIAGATVLVLGCIFVVLPGTALSAMIAGITLLVLSHRRWNENLADAALALITLSIVSACMIGLSRPPWSPRGYAAILNRALIGLAIMTWFWHWTARVWTQQLDQGKAWTTTGRLIRTGRRVGFLIACTGVLVSLHLTLWPNLLYVLDMDNSDRRWMGAIGGNTLLLLALLRSLHGTGRSTIGWLVMFTVGSGIGFAIVRAPNSTFGSWTLVHWPLVLAALGGLSLILGRLLQNRRAWRAMQEPLIYTGVLLAPLGAILGITLTDAALIGQSPRWMPAATFGLLAVDYLIAAIYPGPATFAIVTALCSAVGLSHLPRLTGRTFLPGWSFYTLLAGLCLALVAATSPLRSHPGISRIAKWLAVALIALSLVIGWIMGR